MNLWMLTLQKFVWFLNLRFESKFNWIWLQCCIWSITWIFTGILINVCCLVELKRLFLGLVSIDSIGKKSLFDSLSLRLILDLISFKRWILIFVTSFTTNCSFNSFFVFICLVSVFLALLHENKIWLWWINKYHKECVKIFEMII